ncbi:SCO3242 family prenyltransferase [Streptomyces sp. NPDC001661]
MSGAGRAWAELLRLPALFTLPGDVLAGAAAAGSRPTRGTLLALGASVSLYTAGMALNDWADRDEDARDRPHRPLPSGRIRPTHALAAAGALTATGLALAHRSDRTTGAVAAALAATVWAYDLRLKSTAAGPAAMGTARALDLLMGATATVGAGARGALRPAVAVATDRAGTPGAPDLARTAAAFLAGARGALNPLRAGGADRAGTSGAPGPDAAPAGARVPLRPASAALANPAAAAVTLAVHTTAVTTVSRAEAQGGSSAAPLKALATGAAIAATLLTARAGRPVRGSRPTSPAPVAVALPAAAYAVTALRPLLHAALNPSPALTQRAVGAGIRALVPLQSALAARSGAPVTALATLALAPLARRFAKKVSIT